MFVAHLPAGYLLGRAMGARPRGLMPLALAASVAPDLDLLWFYGPGGRRLPHHDYPTHTPAFWLALGALLWLALRAARVPAAGRLAAAATASALLHLVLDTVAGGIRWLWPLADAELRLAWVPAVHGWWVWNFVLHPTFLLEIALAAAALLAWSRRAA